jgi:hypothetical protein
MMAIDQNRNGLIEESEFISAFENARNANVVMIESPAKSSRIQNSQFDDDRRRQLPTKN